MPPAANFSTQSGLFKRINSFAAALTVWLGAFYGRSSPPCPPEYEGQGWGTLCICLGGSKFLGDFYKLHFAVFGAVEDHDLAFGIAEHEDVAIFEVRFLDRLL
jgi:hypothetical protein